MGRTTKDLTGLVYGDLTVLERDTNYASKTGQVVRWVCQCSCGTIKSIVGIDIINEKTDHCGCLTQRGTHNKTRSPEWNTWVCIRQRMKPTFNGAKYYYDKGINIDPRWDESFEVFLEDMGEKPFPEASIDRLDNSRGYWKDNCRWATAIEQGTNRDIVKPYTYKGETQKLPDWAREYGISNSVLAKRLRNGWEFEEALLTPVETQQPVLITYNGETKSQSEWEKQLGFKNNMIGKRLALGWSIEDAISTPRHVIENRVQERYYTVNGETKRLSEWAKQYGLTPTAINQRIKKGMTVEEAITIPKAFVVLDTGKIKNYLESTCLSMEKIANLCNCTRNQVKTIKKTLSIQRPLEYNFRTSRFK